MQSVTDGWTDGQIDDSITPTADQTIKVNMLLLTVTKMCANTHVTSSASQVLVLTVWYVLVCNRVEVFFCKAKVYNMDDVVMTGWSTPN